MTILVTGAGLIGLETARRLNARGERVHLLDIRPPAVVPRGVTFHQCDVTDFAQLEALVLSNTVRRIVHTAAVLSTGLRAAPLDGLTVNVMGSANIFELAKRHALERVVNISSATVFYSAFARHGETPIDEDVSLRLVSEAPASLYAISKLTTEQLSTFYNRQLGGTIVSLRFGAVVGGAHADPTSVPGRLLATLVEGGRTGVPVALTDPFLVWQGTEEFVDVRDCAGAILAALDAQTPTSGIYNIVHPDQYTLVRLIETVRAVFPDLKIASIESTNTGFAGFPHVRPAPTSIEAARRELDFAPQHDLADTVRHWYQSEERQRS